MLLRFTTTLLIFLALMGCGRQNLKKDLTHEPGNPLVSEGKWSALHESIDQKRLSETMDLIKKGVNVKVISSSPKEHKITPLHLAVKRELFDIAKLLIEKGARVNAEMSTGATPLHVAVETKQIEMVKLLLEHGANPRLESFYVHSPLKIAENAGHTEILKLLEKQTNQVTQP
jgi:ankyrin repeat protein